MQVWKSTLINSTFSFNKHDAKYILAVLHSWQMTPNTVLCVEIVPVSSSTFLDLTVVHCLMTNQWDSSVSYRHSIHSFLYTFQHGWHGYSFNIAPLFFNVSLCFTVLSCACSWIFSSDLCILKLHLNQWIITKRQNYWDARRQDRPVIFWSDIWQFVV